MRALLAAAGALALATLPALGQPSAANPFKISFNPARDVQLTSETDAAGNTVRYVTVRFTITRVGEVQNPEEYKQYKIRIKEKGKFVKEVGVPEPTASDDITAVLAMDISGSMADLGRIQQAREAAKVFFGSLPARAECGLILFDHEVKVKIPPQKDRAALLDHVMKTPPDGGTAYFDATMEAVRLLESAPTRGKVVVLMTDGVDINSKATLKEAIQRAVTAGVRVYTIGIGEAGRNPKVTTVLALDRSASMLEPAQAGDKGKRKIDALQEAATRFVDIMRTSARATVMEFSDTVSPPGPFTASKDDLRQRIHNIVADGETAFLDAAYTALATLTAENPPDNKAVVVLTDGIDNSSRRRKEEVIDRALKAKIPIYMLGLGRDNELDEDTMRELAAKTNGQYYRASNAKALLQAFEKLSIKLHDDGIDEVSLKELASQTGGQFYPAKQIDQLKVILNSVTKDVLEKDYEVKFKTEYQDADGTTRELALELVRGTEVLDTQVGATQVRGLVKPEMNYLVYLFLLAGLAGLLGLPPLLRKLTRGPARA